MVFLPKLLDFALEHTIVIDQSVIGVLGLANSHLKLFFDLFLCKINKKVHWKTFALSFWHPEPTPLHPNFTNLQALLESLPVLTHPLPPKFNR